ncbi:hypothetical protein [Sunxiuqinia indica]|uniref:hypothetical protein n=1 Tax=Sunxiuqinia indica TaxID=2692584 RepID=UPI00135C1DFD|nr:hypothetical protein [Sunxiuqinia indica]
MKFEADTIYHIFNRSNEPVFKSRTNYLFFKERLRAYVHPCCNILAWCLVPNHFHLLVQLKPEGLSLRVNKNGRLQQQLAVNLRLMTSSYTRAYNKENRQTGRYFSQPTKAKILNHERVAPLDDFANVDYITTCFLYIHQIPVIHNLVSHPSKWEMSSFNSYIHDTDDGLVDKDIAFQYISLEPEAVDVQSTSYLDESILDNLY